MPLRCDDDGGGFKSMKWSSKVNSVCVLCIVLKCEGNVAKIWEFFGQVTITSMKTDIRRIIIIIFIVDIWLFIQNKFCVYVDLLSLSFSVYTLWMIRSEWLEWQFRSIDLYSFTQWSIKIYKNVSFFIVVWLLRGHYVLYMHAYVLIANRSHR